MKSPGMRVLPYCGGSLPVRGAWIEMRFKLNRVTGEITSLPVRGAWIEIAYGGGMVSPNVSLPVRGAWIEI